MSYKIHTFLSLLALALAAALPAGGQNLPQLSETAPSGTSNAIVVPPAPLDTFSSLNTVCTYIPRIPVQSPAAADSDALDAWVHKITVFQDGFNRTYQTVTKDYVKDNTYKDLVEISDNRPQTDHYSFLPYTVNSTSDAPPTLQSNSFAAQYAFYQGLYPGEGYTAYTGRRYYSDPDTREVRSYAPGKSQVGQNRAIAERAVSNDAWTGSTDAPVVRIWKLDDNDAPVSPGYYPANTLIGILSYDSAGAQVLTFKDKSGRLIFKRVLLQTVTSGQTVTKVYGTTYYIYDSKGRLRYTLPPKATEAAGSTVSATVLDNLCFQYQYDSKGRRSAQQKPGEQGFTVMVYDRKQRPVMRQTPKEAADHIWEVTFHDQQGRVIATSLYTSGDSRDTWQSLFDDYDGTTYATSDLRYYLLTDEGEGVYPDEDAISGNAMMSYLYYDNYDITDPDSQVFDNCLSTLNFTEQVAPPGAELESRSMRTQGLLTGSKVRILPAPGADTAKTGAWKETVNYFDDKGRGLYTASFDLYHGSPVHTHYMGMEYSFSNQVLMSKHVLINSNSADGQTQRVELTHNIYDAVTGRLTGAEHSVDGGPWNELATYKYDALGRLGTEILGDYGEFREYDYNIRGQLTGINGHYAETGNKQSQDRTFGESLKYDYGFTQPRYDGKAAGMVWRGSGGTADMMRAYGYDYDNSGRLARADYREYREISGSYQWNNSKDDRTVKDLSYDDNGNILSMTQRGTAMGQISGQVAVDIDHLSYNYATNSNQLLAVTDTVSTDYGTGDFQDGHTHGADYAYDAAGNLTEDLNKGITGITYTYFNKPQTITFANGNIITYSYTAGGDKVEELVQEGTAHKRTDYTGNFVYRNDSLQYASTAVGRTVWQNDTTKEEFFVKDHLGNVRSVVDVYQYPLHEYLATYEIASAQLENLFFDDVDGIRDDKPESTDPSDTKAGRLNGSEPDHRVGTSLLLKVMAGDKVQLNVNSYYDGYDATEDQPVDGEQILESIVSTLTGGEGGLGESESHDPELVDRLFTPENYANAADLLDANTDPSKPKAFLNYILFNEEMQVVGSFTGSFQATGDGDWTAIGTQQPLVIPANGYLAVYLDNASTGDVFFDQLQVRFTQGHLKEEAHYYPFGLPMGDIGSAAVGFTPNRRKYQTNEYIKDAGLNWMNFHARQFDPQIGRFMGVDPLAASGGQDRLSPYAAMGDEPAGNVDPGGMRYGYSYSNFPHPMPNPWAGFSPGTLENLKIDPHLSAYYNDGGYFNASADANEAAIYAQGMADLAELIAAVRKKEGSGPALSINAMTDMAYRNPGQILEFNEGRYVGFKESTYMGKDQYGNKIYYYRKRNWTSGLVGYYDESMDAGTKPPTVVGQSITNENWTNKFLIGLGAVDVAAGSQEVVLGLEKSLSDLKYTKGLKVTGRVFFALQAGISIYSAGSAIYTDDPNKWGVVGKSALDISMGAIATFGGPVGWVIGGVYFVGDAAGWWGEWGNPTGHH